MSEEIEFQIIEAILTNGRILKIEVREDEYDNVYNSLIGHIETGKSFFLGEFTYSCVWLNNSEIAIHWITTRDIIGIT